MFCGGSDILRRPRSEEGSEADAATIVFGELADHWAVCSLGILGFSPTKGIGAIAVVGWGRRRFSYNESQGQGEGVLLILSGQALDNQTVGCFPARAGRADFERRSREIAAFGFGDGTREHKPLRRLDFFSERLILRSCERRQQRPNSKQNQPINLRPYFLIVQVRAHCHWIAGFRKVRLLASLAVETAYTLPAFREAMKRLTATAFTAQSCAQWCFPYFVNRLMTVNARKSGTPTLRRHAAGSTR